MRLPWRVNPRAITFSIATPILPNAIIPVLDPFATLFRSPTWLKAQILLVGAILAPGQRTVAAALRVTGLSDDRNYARYIGWSTGRCGRPAERLASCSCCCSSTWTNAIARWSSASPPPASNRRRTQSMGAKDVARWQPQPRIASARIQLNDVLGRLAERHPPLAQSNRR